MMRVFSVLFLVCSLSLNGMDAQGKVDALRKRMLRLRNAIEKKETMKRKKPVRRTSKAVEKWVVMSGAERLAMLEAAEQLVILHFGK
jgi:hypothetical protein